MTIQDTINKLERDLAVLKAQQSRCTHDWNEPTVVMVDTKEEHILPGQYERYGVDMWPRSTFIDVKVPRWTRSCKVCGLVQHTDKQKEVTQPTVKVPDFGY